MLYKKNPALPIFIFSISIFAALIIGLHIAIKPFHQVEDKLDIIEKNVISENWDIVNKNLKEINDLWDKYEVLLRVMNNMDINDDFTVSLKQCTVLGKYKDNRIIEYLPILKEDVNNMMHVIPSP